jgi:hypothetical protein
MTQDNPLIVQVAVASSSGVRGTTFSNTSFKQIRVPAEKSFPAFFPSVLPVPRLQAGADGQVCNQPTSVAKSLKMCL